MYGDVETYANEALGRLAWFVPLEFGLAGVLSAVAVPALEGLVVGTTRSWTPWERIREVPLLIGLYFTSVGANGANSRLFLAALLVLLAVRTLLVPVRGDWAFALVAAVLGPAVEAAIHATGAFRYTEPDFLGIPVWLPALWANGGLAIRRLFGGWDGLSAVPEPDEPSEHAYVG